MRRTVLTWCCPFLVGGVLLASALRKMRDAQGFVDILLTSRLAAVAAGASAHRDRMDTGCLDPRRLVSFDWRSPRGEPERPVLRDHPS